MIDKAGHLKFLLFTNSFESCLEPKIDLYSFGVLLYQLVHNGMYCLLAAVWAQFGNLLLL